MAVNEIKSFLHMEKVQQTSLMQVTYFWEIKLAYVDKEGFYGYAYTTFNRDEIKWAHLDTFSEEQAIESMINKCKKESK
ncbi:hypothetical protein DT035_08615 [Bacillus subtilis]|uniref:hypothetical protein n=1 Tax=Bacillus subtilis TaxID=1423 RepID=UPI00145B4074|nr:hypothetical protein [Bacillus subtilis]MBA5714893.1 hypothetical protein [Bacillus subtilis]QNK37969.1 hypothetical protein H8S71_06390 [Bacillus subtilis subsp. subtilis]